MPLPTTDKGDTASAAQVVYDADSASIAVRDRALPACSCCSWRLRATAGQDYSVVTNLVDVGGLPAAIDFVHNAQGLRLVALVGSSAVLV